MFETIRQNSAYRSVRYSTVRKDSLTADRSARQNSIRFKAKPVEDSTFYKTRTIDVKPQTAAQTFYNPEKSSYLQSFDSMFQSEKKVKNKQEDSFQPYQIKIKFTNFDSSFLQEDGTEFTLLDPFHRPYSYLTGELKKQQKQLQNQKDDIRLLKAQLNTMKRNILQSLKNTQEEGKKGVDRLRFMIKKNEVESQETKMRVRREITQLYQKHDDNLKLNRSLDNRSKNMQRDIFNCEPFELQVQAQ